MALENGVCDSRNQVKRILEINGNNERNALDNKRKTYLNSKNYYRFRSCCFNDDH